MSKDQEGRKVENTVKRLGLMNSLVTRGRSGDGDTADRCIRDSRQVQDKEEPKHRSTVREVCHSGELERGEQKGGICVSRCKRGGRQAGPCLRPGFCVFILGFSNILCQLKKEVSGKL